MSETPSPFGRMSLHAGAGSRVECFTYQDTTPILDIDVGAASIAVCIVGKGADDAVLTFARALARQAERFAAEVERIHTLQARTGDKATKGTAA